MSRSRRALVISDQPQIQRALAVGIRAAGTTPDVCEGLDALPPGPIPHRFVFFAWNGSPERLAQLLPRVRASAQVVSIVPPCELAGCLGIIRDRRCNHVLVGEESGTPPRGLGVTASKLLTGDIFGIEKYLPELAEVRCIRLRDYAGRTHAVDAVSAFAKEIGVRRQARAAIAQACEELLMNALYDAPVDEQGRAIFGEVTGKDRIQQPSPRPVSIRYAASNDSFAVAVRDRFGVLKKDTILHYLEKCLRATDQIDRKTSGAGLGLYLVANTSTQYVVNVAPGIATEVVCTFDRAALRTSLRTFSVFLHPGAQAKALVG